MINQETYKLFQRYLKGKSTPEEIQNVNKWYDSLNNEPDADLSILEQDVLKSRLLEGIKAKIEAEETRNGQAKKFSSNYSPIFRFLPAAAAIFLMALGFFFLYTWESKSGDTRKEMIIVSNLTGLIQKRILPDSTIVWLYPKSTIKYPKKFSGHLRLTRMDGEIFFDVKPDRKHPFVIYGGGVVTRVLGTSFFMKARKNRPTEVCVLTGKVSVSIPEIEETEVFLLPRQQAVLSKTEPQLLRKNEKQVSVPKMWEKKSISFENTSMPEILKALNTQFKINIHTSEKNILLYTLNADFTNQSLPEILEMLSKSLNVTYEINGNTIILKNNQ